MKLSQLLRKLLPLVAAGGLLSCAQHLAADESLSRSRDFTADWAFCLGDDTLAALPGYDDSSWRRLDLPHDWAIEGDFSQDNPSGVGGGALPGGVGWYRKTFRVDEADRGRRLYIDFDGVYMNSSVYINGHCLGTRPYGYISFRYDLTPYVRWGEENTLAVRVDNAEQPNSRWYSGCGIYRNVRLTCLDPVHVAQWGTYVTASDVSDRQARLCVRTTVENTLDADASLTIRTDLIDQDGQTVLTATSTPLSARADTLTEAVQTMDVPAPQLWSVERPYLYTVRTTLLSEGRTLDVYDTPFGFRSFCFDAQKGFILNGRRMKINGVCLHPDL